MVILVDSYACGLDRAISSREFCRSYDGISVDSLPTYWVAAWNALAPF
ncbi:MAG: hypothetical protein WC495_07285 [Patescibacteria group bacterium]